MTRAQERAAALRALAQEILAASNPPVRGAHRITLALWGSAGVIARAIDSDASTVQAWGRAGDDCDVAPLVAELPARLLAAAALLDPAGDAAAAAAVPASVHGPERLEGMDDDPLPPPADPPRGRSRRARRGAAGDAARVDAPPPTDAPAGRPKALARYVAPGLGTVLDTTALAEHVKGRAVVALAPTPDRSIVLAGVTVRRALAAASKRAASTGAPLRVSVQLCVARQWCLVLAWRTGRIRLTTSSALIDTLRRTKATAEVVPLYSNAA